MLAGPFISDQGMPRRAAIPARTSRLRAIAMRVRLLTVPSRSIVHQARSPSSRARHRSSPAGAAPTTARQDACAFACAAWEEGAEEAEEAIPVLAWAVLAAIRRSAR